MRSAALLACLVLFAACGRTSLPAGGDGSTAGCAHLQSVRQVRGVTLCEDAWTCSRPPRGVFDRVGLRRIARCDGADDGPVVLYLPGAYMNADLPITDARYDLRLHLALEGVRAWGLDYRTHAVPPVAQPAELQPVAGWNAETFAEDAAWAASFIRGGDPGPFYLAGFSFGAGLAYRVAARGDVQVSGLVILDGTAASAAPEGGPRVLDVGSSRLPYAARQQLLERVMDGPPGGGLEEASARLVDVLYTAPSFGGRGGLSNAKNGLSDPWVLATLLASYDRWWPRAALGGGDPGRPPAPLPVLAFAGGQMGEEWVARVRASAQRFGGEAAQVRVLPLHGHLDVLVGKQSARLVYEPVLRFVYGR